MKNYTLFIVLIFGFIGTSQAQFLNKLLNKAEKAAANTVERKVEEKTEEKTEEIIDSALEKKEKEATEATESTTKAEPESTYAFNHRVKMKMTTGKDELELVYHLPEDSSYFCAEIQNEDVKEKVYTVYDASKETMFTFMETAGMKMRMAVEFKTEEETDSKSTFEIVATGNKKDILGYSCEEYLITGEDLTITAWVTRETGIRFPSIYSASSDSQSNQEWTKELDGWVMKMELTDTSKRKPTTINLEVLSIEKSDFKIDSSEYKNIGG